MNPDLFALDDLPEPLNDTSVDCRGLPFMPLEITRLRESELVAVSSGDEFKAAVLLWAKSWTEIPAGSLPNDDRILMKATGYFGAAFSRIKKGALHGWILCSDGRFYHPLISDLALIAAKKRKKRSEAANSRWAAERAKKAGKSAKPAPPRNAPADASSNANGMVGRGTGTDTDKTPQTPLSEKVTLESIGGPEAMTLSDYFEDERNRVFAKYPISPEKRKANVWHMAKGVLEAFGSSKAAAGKLVGEISRDYSLTDDELGNIALRIFEAKPTAPRPFAIGCAKQIARERQALEERKGTATTISAEDLAYQRRVMAEYVARPASWPSREFNGWPGSQTCMIEPEILVEFGYEVPSWRALA